MKKFAVRAGRGSAGFSLIELLTVVAVVGILGAIALPAYNNYIIRGKRAEGRNALMDLAARQERFYSDNNQYTATLGGGGLGYTEPSGCGTTAGDQTETCKYTITVALGGGGQTFTITAAPTFEDTDCGSLTLNNTGTKGEGGSSDVRTCWGK
jgi:type IV pilus assembly protein PilE